MPKVEPIINIENIVASAKVKHRMELNSVVKAFPDAEYHPERFPGLVFRLKKPKTSTLIFSSGKMICTGARSEKEAERALRKLVKVLKEGGIIMEKPEIKIVNVVATASLMGSVDLLELYESERSMRGRIVYEPEQFPGLIYRMDSPKTVFLIFSSGKLVCTGAKREEDVHQAVIKLHQQLDEKNLIHHEPKFFSSNLQVSITSQSFRLISFVPPDDVASLVRLEVPWRDQNDVSLSYSDPSFNLPRILQRRSWPS